MCNRYDSLDVTPDDSPEAVIKAKTDYDSFMVYPAYGSSQGDPCDSALLGRLIETHIPNLLERIKLLEEDVALLKSWKID